jgi:hypothetical protein
LRIADIVFPRDALCSPWLKLSRCLLIRNAHSGHSFRSATIGSTRAALRAGSQPANAATANNNSVANAIVNGSLCANPNNIPAIRRVVASATANPIAEPIKTN